MATTYFALIGDVVASRALAAPARTALQAELRAALPDLNRTWRRALAARFAITLGDELQCLLKSPEAVWDVAHAVRVRLPAVDWVIACGRGPLATRLHPGVAAPELDGPCFHAARGALERAKRERLVFAFGGFDDPALDALARYYSALYWNWTRRQRRAANGFRAPAGAPAPHRPRRERVGPIALSHLRRRMAWPLVAAGDNMLRLLIA